MPSTVGQVPCRAPRFNIDTIAFAAIPRLRGLDATTCDVLAARAMACAGLAALVGLPFLLLSTLILGIPLAVPAAIACGYLGTAHALASSRPRRAALISGFVLAALLGWLLLFLLGSEEPLSGGGLTAALLAPIFAAAPALARSVIARVGEMPSGPDAQSEAAQRYVACIDGLLPNEAVVIADRGGAILAATRAARRRLRFLPEAFDHHVSSLFDPADLPSAMDAFGRAASEGETVELTLDTRGRGETGRPVAWVFSPCEGGVSLRFGFETASRIAAERSQATRDRTTTAISEAFASDPVCDIGKAAVFAARCARERAKVKGAQLLLSHDDHVLAACDRQVGRRIVHLAMDQALGSSATGDTIRVDVRRLKGIVLLRVACEHGYRDAGADFRSSDPPKLVTLRTIVDTAGGTLVVGDEAESRVLSIRLELANAEETTKRARQSAEAG